MKKSIIAFGTIKHLIYSFTLLLGTLLFTGCKKEAINEDVADANKEMEASLSSVNLKSDAAFMNMYTGLGKQTTWELQQARAATARYRNIENAIKDGYADISVVVPNMGHHYLRSGILDGVFDIRNPEILVYNKDHDGSFQLVAVEYAIPIDVTPNAAPSGFSGSNDVWDRNTGFGLWLLHAWVWAYNPDGVFNPTNPSVHLH
jgi:hypothetical protein